MNRWSTPPWHGWTFTDTVFPFFLWIVGVAMTLSTAKRVERGDDRMNLWLHVVRRAAMIFLVGTAAERLPLLSPGPDPHSRRAAADRGVLPDCRVDLPVHQGARAGGRHPGGAHLVHAADGRPLRGGVELRPLVRRARAPGTHVVAHQGVGPRGHREHAAGDRDRAVRNAGGARAAAECERGREDHVAVPGRQRADRGWDRSGPSGCPSTRTCGPGRSRCSWRGGDGGVRDLVLAGGRAGLEEAGRVRWPSTG